jgi:hypothetical protein
MFYPVALATVVAEAFGWRSVFYYMCTWGGIAYAGLSSTARWPSLSETYYAQYFDYIAAGSAALGGVAYWAVAVRLVLPHNKKPKQAAPIKRFIESEYWLSRRP